MRGPRRGAAGRAERGRVGPRGMDHARMVRLMVGRELQEPSMCRARAVPASSGSSCAGCGPPRDRAERLSFEVAAGEILGVAGLVGAGRSEMAQAIFGVDPILAGEISPRRPAAGDPRAARRDRRRPLPDPRGPPPRRPDRRDERAREHHAAGPVALHGRGADPPRPRSGGRARAGCGAARADAVGGSARRAVSAAATSRRSCSRAG